jgi:hypothetical protein
MERKSSPDLSEVKSPEQTEKIMKTLSEYVVFDLRVEP